jgi:hypothetical protein
MLLDISQAPDSVLSPPNIAKALAVPPPGTDAEAEKAAKKSQ